jgi:hypothetical protein
MARLSDWHVFNPTDRATYPKGDTPVQARFDNGQMEEGVSRMFFPQVQLLPCSSIHVWRYVKGFAQS